MFPRPTNRLENLELDNNAFTSIPDDLFADMPALKDFSIRTNGIAHLPKRAFKSILSQRDTFDARGECSDGIELEKVTLSNVIPQWIGYSMQGPKLQFSALAKVL
ncbi:unnamed protein product [Larinioides sclopetarius]|uniref:Uncharacterized protein n=1 Tax=Larinioides sclopetarius TaxID=280406 RepID=A0AAV2BCC4_9ARAC